MKHAKLTKSSFVFMDGLGSSQVKLIKTRRSEIEEFLKVRV
jgi:hypothetical protein